MNSLGLLLEADYWKLETRGITDEPDIRTESYESYRDTHLRIDNDGKYDASLPWKHDYPPVLGLLPAAHLPAGLPPPGHLPPGHLPPRSFAASL